MSQETPLSPRDPWVVRSVGAAAAIFVIAVVLGFMVFPLVQRNARAASLWDAICSAAGVSRGPSSGTPVEPGYKVSSAVMTSNMLRGADAEFDRSRRDARPSMRDLPWAYGRQPRRFSQSRRSVRQRDL